jgi:hypothetical protein
VTPAVEEAIQEISRTFPGSRIEAVEDGSGGAFVILEDVPLGDPYQQPTSWIGFQITHTYPYADVYPHFVRHDLSRCDGKPLGEGMAIGAFRNRPAIQVSRRSNRLDPATNTALLKLLKVLKWLNSRP